MDKNNINILVISGPKIKGFELFEKQINELLLSKINEKELIIYHHCLNDKPLENIPTIFKDITGVFFTDIEDGVIEKLTLLFKKAGEKKITFARKSKEGIFDLALNEVITISNIGMFPLMVKYLN